MVYIETNTELNQEQIDKTTTFFNDLILDDLNVFVDSDQIVWYSDGELYKKMYESEKELTEFKLIFNITGDTYMSMKYYDHLDSVLFHDERNYNNADNTSGQYIYSLDDISRMLELIDEQRGNQDE